MACRYGFVAHGLWLTGLCAAMLLTGSLGFILIAQEQGGDSRQIVAEEFTNARPNKPKPSPTTTRPSTTGSRQRTDSAATNTARRRPPPRYRRSTTDAIGGSATTPPARNNSAASTAASAIPSSAAKVGVTIWRLRPVRATDNGARILVMEDGRETQLTPERVESGAQLRVSDRVRLTIESPRNGYLYVVDRELYADGSMGDPFLIFPTQRTRGGDNRALPGKLIDIPGQEDRPNYFTLVPSPSREDQVAEVLSIIITTQPLENFEITDKPVKLSKSQVEKWEKQWSTRVEKYEMEGGAGQTWSREERAASAEDTGRYLTQEDPSPQTIYLVEGKNNQGLLVTVPLRYKR